MSDAVAPLADAPPASAIADVLALWGRDGWLSPPLAPIIPAAGPIGGTARVVVLDHAPSGPGLAPLYELLDGDLGDQTLVLAGAHRASGAVWGEILASSAARTSPAAVLVDGAVRDVTDLPSTPLYARSTNVVGPNGRAHVIAVDAPATIDAVAIATGDLVVSDPTGCVRVNSTEIATVMEGARFYAAAEEEVLQAIRTGTPLSEAYLLKKSAVDQLRKG